MSDNRHLPAGHPLHGKRIAIVGGGPAGLMLARLLQQCDVSVTVFERDASAEARTQGGSLDLHADSGQCALIAAGLETAFRVHARPEGQRSRVFDKAGALHVDMRAEDEGQSSPEIDRGALRRILLDSLEPETVRWGRRLMDVRRSAGAVRLSFDDGPIEVDVVFGCDGGWSKVRPLVSDLHRPAYSGATFVQSFIADVDRRHPGVAAFVGSGNVMALGDARGLAAQRNGDGAVRVYAMLTVPEDWVEASGVDFSDAGCARKALLRLFADWPPEFRTLVAASDDSFEPWPLYVRPARQAWPARADATLLGDAAHIMPPFTGRGANYALLDALELADALTGAKHSDLAAALAAYERGMLHRMEAAIEETMASQNLLLASDAPTGLAAMITGRPHQEASA